MAGNNQNNKELLQYAGLATQWLVMLGLSVWAGMAIDNRMNEHSRLFTIILPLLALSLSLWQLIRKFNKPKK
ncbi:MAG: hypothetical protein QM530_04140 [Phycisphaerales bacterium]|nr:hypothetical protein [Phycisphaerales bacterium]